jgi:hypothetical protein
MTPTEQVRLGDRLEAMDALIDRWALGTKDNLLKTLSRFGIQDKLELAKVSTRLKKQQSKAGSKVVPDPYLFRSLRYKLRKKEGEIESVGFGFSRHGIFLEHGVGKGRKVGSSAAVRSKKPWLSSVLPLATEILADVLASDYADIMLGTLKMQIPGILDVQYKTEGNRLRVVDNMAAQREFENRVQSDFEKALQADEREMAKAYLRSQLQLR